MAMKAETKAIFNYLRENNGAKMTAQDVADALGYPNKKGVDGAFTSFQKKGWGIRQEAEVELADGSHSKVKYLVLTDEGLAVNIDEQ